jgi:hypothetical protein
MQCVRSVVRSAIAAAAIVALAPGATAGVFAHPTAVSLKHGSSSSTEAQAVDLLNGSTGDQYYGVVFGVVHGTAVTSFDVTFTGVADDPPKTAKMTLQWEGHASGAPCDLTLALFRWDDTRWVGQTTEAISTGGDVFLYGRAVRKGDFLRHGKARGRITCRSLNKFELLSDQVRLLPAT